MFTTLYINFSDAQRQVTPQSLVPCRSVLFSLANGCYLHFALQSCQNTSMDLTTLALLNVKVYIFVSLRKSIFEICDF